MPFNRKSGSIECICGGMFSGKSEELIRRVRRATYGKQKVRVFKPLIDDRYSEDSVVSHDGKSVHAQPIEWSKDILKLVDYDTDVVAIDRRAATEVVPVCGIDDRFIRALRAGKHANNIVGRALLGAGFETHRAGQIHAHGAEASALGA